MIATLGRSENSPYFGVADLRSYDVWGAVRSGSTTGDPKQRYCANLGHVQDDESGLIYMRARYYEPWTGRFISEDPANDGWNWFVYGGNNPVEYGDYSGRSVFALLLSVIRFVIGELLMDIQSTKNTKLVNLARWQDQLMDMEALASTLKQSFNTSEELARLRLEIVLLRRQIRLARLASIGHKLSGTASAIAKLLGYSFIIGSLIDDVDLGVSGPGALDLLYGS